MFNFTVLFLLVRHQHLGFRFSSLGIYSPHRSQPCVVLSTTYMEVEAVLGICKMCKLPHDI